MAQEVQTTLNWYETPNRIEGIWISERKIKEHYQVTPQTWYWIVATSSLTPSAWYQERDYNAQGTLTINSYSWQTLFTAMNKGIRIPTAWWYLARISRGGWSSNFSVTLILKTDNETLYSATFSNGTEVKELSFNLWKFDILQFRVTWYYSWSGSASTTANITLSLQKL